METYNHYMKTYNELIKNLIFVIRININNE